MQVYAHYLINYVSVGAENHAKRSHHLAVLLHSTIKPPAYRDVSFRLPVVMMKSRSDVKDQVYPSQNPNCRMVCVQHMLATTDSHHEDLDRSNLIHHHPFIIQNSLIP